MNNVFKHLYHPVPSSTVSCRSVSYCWQKRGINITSTLQEAKGGSTPQQGFTKIYVTEIHIDVGKKRIHTISFILFDHKCVAILHYTVQYLCVLMPLLQGPGGLQLGDVGEEQRGL